MIDLMPMLTDGSAVAALNCLVVLVEQVVPVVECREGDRDRRDDPVAGGVDEVA